jgi:hypothetical protein
VSPKTSCPSFSRTLPRMPGSRTKMSPAMSSFPSVGHLHPYAVKPAHDHTALGSSSSISSWVAR